MSGTYACGCVPSELRLITCLLCSVTIQAKCQDMMTLYERFRVLCFVIAPAILLFSILYCFFQYYKFKTICFRYLITLKTLKLKKNKYLTRFSEQVCLDNNLWVLYQYYEKRYPELLLDVVWYQSFKFWYQPHLVLMFTLFFFLALSAFLYFFLPI